MDYWHLLQDGLISHTSTGSDGSIKSNIKNGKEGTPAQKKKRAKRSAGSRRKKKVLANIKPYSSIFLTMTYSDGLCSEREFVKHITYYFTRKLKGKWAYFFEKGSKKARLHIHALIFTDTTLIIPKWKYGRLRIKTTDEHIVRMGNYFAKYHHTDTDSDMPDYIKRSFRTSQGLNKPVPIDSIDIDKYRIVHSEALIYKGHVCQNQIIYADNNFLSEKNTMSKK